MVWRPEWQVHANGATCMAAVDVEVPDIASALPSYIACTAAAPVNAGDCTLFQLDACALRLHPGTGAARMTGLTFGCTSLERVAAVLAAATIAFERAGNLLTVDPVACFGTKLQFTVPAR
jgi:hypothetical protein